MALDKIKTNIIDDDAVTGAKIENNPTIAGNATVTGTSQLTGAVTLGSGGTNWTLPTARGIDGYVLTTTSGTGSWIEIALAPDITALTWYSDSGYSETLTAAEAINKNPAPVTTTGTLGSGGTIRKITSITTTNISIGDTVTGTGIGTSAVVSSVDTSGASNDGTITLSVDNTGSGSQSLTFTSAATPSTYLKISGLNLGSAVSFGTTAYVQIINTSDSNAVVGHNQNSLNGCITASQRVTDSELRFTINTNGVSGIVAGNTLKVKIITGGGEELFDIGYTVSADPTSITTVNSATIANTATVGTFGGLTAGGGEDSDTKIFLEFDRGGSKNPDFEDSSNLGGNGHKVTVGGGAAITASPFGDGKSAMYFDGSDGQTNSIVKLAAWEGFGTGDFCFELWVRCDDIDFDSNNVMIFDGRKQTASATRGFLLQIESSTGNLKIHANDGSSSTDLFAFSEETNLKEGEWTHVAIVRRSSKVYLYLDGTERAVSGTNDVDYSSSELAFGGYPDGDGYNFVGYLDEIRIVVGTSVYTGEFTPPTARFSGSGSDSGINISTVTAAQTKLLIHSNKDEDLARTGGEPMILEVGSTGSFRSASSSPAIASTPTGLSDGGFYGDANTNTFVRIDNGDNAGLFGITTGDFTIDYWFRVHATNSSGSRPFSDGKTSGAGMSIWMSNARALKLYWSSNNSGWTPFGGTDLGHSATLNTWEHHCLSRKAGTKYMFHVNGILKWHHTGDTTLSMPTDMGNGLLLGKDGASNNEFTAGTWKNFRVSSNFRPEQSGDPCFVHASPGSTTGGSVGDNSSFAAFDVTSSSANAEFNYTGDGTSSSRGDGIDDYTKCMVPLDNGIFADSATTGTTHTVTNLGVAHRQSHKGIASALTFPASGRKYGSSGCYFDGAGDYLTMTTQPALGTGAFTFDCWVYYSSRNGAGGNAYIWDGGLNESKAIIGIYVVNSTSRIVVYDDASTADVFTSAAALALTRDTWTHVALVRTGQGSNLTKLYFNGVLKATGTCAGDLTETAYDARIGGYHGNSNYFEGYIDAFRISSTARWTEAFTPPTKIYGSISSNTIDTISLAGTPGSGGGNVHYAVATLSGSTETAQSLPTGLTLNETTDVNNTATITGSITAAAGTHSIPLVARVTSDIANVATANIDPNRKQDYTHTVTVNEGSEPVLFNARRYVGTGVEKELTGFGFKPDLIWIKDRPSSSAGNHMVQNSLRTYNSVMHTDNANEYQSNTTGVRSFNPDGVTMLGDVRLNKVDIANIAWGWKAGGAPSAVGKKMTNGTETNLTSSTDYSGVSSIKQSVNTTGGFSITIYNGNSSTAWIKHGLHATEKPDLVIIKGVSNAGAWAVWHSSYGDPPGLSGGSLAGHYLVLDTNGSFQDGGTTLWNNTGPTTDGKVNFGSSGTANTSGQTYVMYCWKAVTDVSYFGWYTGTGSGLNVPTTGFVPRFIMLKNATNNGNWLMLDSFRTTFSGSAWNNTHWIMADATTAEGNTGSANCQGRLGFNAAGSAYEGFSLNADNANHNASGHKYIYIAFA